MEREGMKFGRGSKELTGSVDLISQFKLLPPHEFFCKKSAPLSVSDTRYFRNVVGDTEVRKGEGMQLDQLIQKTPHSREGNAQIQPFQLDALRDAFLLREAAPICLPTGEKGLPTISGKSNSTGKDKEKKREKHKDREHEKDREHKKYKHHYREHSNMDVEKMKSINGVQYSRSVQMKKYNSKVMFVQR